MTTNSATYLTNLHQLLNQYFNLAEIRTLCFNLGVDYESVAGDEKPSRIRELLLALGRNGRLPDLLTLLQQDRPHVDWPPLPDDFRLPEALAGETAVSDNQYHIYGDLVQGDKVSGDKVAGNVINTDGGAYIGGNVNTGGGDFAGHDMTISETDEKTIGLEQLENRPYIIKITEKGSAFGDVYTAGGHFIGHNLIINNLKVEEIENKPPKSCEPPCVPPYQGLLSFDKDDWDRFFGRDVLTAQIVSRLHDANFLTVVGPSGSGKSSVVRAGVVPAILGWKELIKDVEPLPANWKDIIITPTSQPLAKIAETLFPDNATAQDELQKQMQESDIALANALNKISTTDNHRRLIVVDQFEELFTLCDEDEIREAFAANLLYIAQNQQPQLKIILALRADFYHLCLENEKLAQLMPPENQINVTQMKAEELAEAILRPAANGGWKLQVSLVDLMIEDAGEEPGALPLLSHALLETWNNRGWDTMTLHGYKEEAGGVKGAIARTANKTLGNLSESEQLIAKRLFLRLTKIGPDTLDTRQKATFANIDDDATTRHVRQQLEQARLIVADEDGLEIAHEALIREWPRLKGWLNTNREGLIIHQRLQDARERWQEKGEDPSSLYRGLLLTEAEQWVKISDAVLHNLERKFLTASLNQQQKEIEEKEAQQRRELQQAKDLAEEQRQRAEAVQKRSVLLRRALILGGVLVLFLLVATIFASIQTNNAQENLSIANIRGTEAAVGEAAALAAGTAEAEALETSIADANARATAVVRAEAGESTALAAGTAEAKALATSEAESTRAFLSEGIAQAEAATAEYNFNVAATREQEAIIAGEQALAQSLVANSRALMSNRNITNQELVQARLLSIEGGRLNQEVGQPQDQTLSQSLLYALAVEKPDAYQPTITLANHTARVSSVAWNGNSSRLASASFDNTVIIWDTDSWQPLETLTNHTDFVRSVAWNKDGSRLASASDDGTVIIWDTDNWKPLETLTNHTNIVYSVTWDRDGSRLATASYDKTVIIWDTSNWQPLKTLTNHTDGVSSVAWNRDSSRLASASWDKTVIIWDADSWKPITALTHNDWVRSVAWNGDGNRLATGLWDNSIVVWDADNWQPLERLIDHTNTVSSLAWKEGGGRLASASDDGTVIIWNTNSWEPLSTLTEHTNGVSTATWNGDGSRLVTGSWDNSVIVWDTDSWNSQTTLTDYTRRVGSVAWNRDGSYLASGFFGNSTIVWNTDSWNPLIELTDDTATTFGRVNAVVWNDSGNRLAFASANNNVTIWDTDSWRPLETLTSHTDFVNSVAWNRDGSRLASASDDNTIIIWEADGWRLLATLTNHTAQVSSVAWNSDGSRLASASFDNTIIIWDTVSWQPLETLTSHTDKVTSVVWNKSGSRLASASFDDTVIIWDTESWQPVTTLIGHITGVTNVAWNENSSRLASASFDNTIIIWDTVSWQPLATLTNHISFVNSVAWNEDGNHLASASSDNTIIIWNFPDFSALHCSLAGRNLSLAEWEQFLPGVAYRRTCAQWPSGAGAPADAPLWGE